MNERIKQVRISQGLTQEEFGELFGIQKSAVSKIEKGIVTPTEATLKLICATYSVNYLWLTQGEGPIYRELDDDEKLTAFVNQYAPDASPFFKAQVMAAVKYLTDEEWKIFCDFVNSLRDQVKNGWTEEKAAP